MKFNAFKKILKKIGHIIIPNTGARRRMISMMRETGIIKHSLYGKIYNPIYILNVPYVSQYPNFYNSDGNKMELFFLRDIHTAHRPYSGSKYFEWDRYNIGDKRRYEVVSARSRHSSSG